MPTIDPSLEALEAMYKAVREFNEHPSDDEESADYKRKAAASMMAYYRYKATMPTTGAGRRRPRVSVL